MIYVKRMIALISLILSGIVLFTIITYCYRGELTHTRSNVAGYYAEEKDSLDVIILGTSSTFSAFMPMEAWKNYGIVSYNLCTNVLFENSMKYYVREIKKTQSPQLLVVDIAPFLYGHNADVFLEIDDLATVHRNTDGLPMSINRIELINELVPAGKERISYYFDLLYYKTAEPVYEYWTNKRHSVTKGYHNLPLAVTYTEESRITSINNQEGNLPEKEEEYLKELLAELKTFEGEVLFISQPIFYDESMEDKFERNQYIQNLIAENGFAYLDMTEYTEEIGIDPIFDYSLDQLHFHSLSAQKITAFLSKYITDNYDIPDRREDKQYLSWHKDYTEWEKVLESEVAITCNERDEFLLEAINGNE